MSSDAAVAKESTGTRPPALAVIINCFNYERYIQSAIQSVVSQNNRDCEVVVIDDGSTDGSWSIIQRSGVRAFRKENGGQVSACLLGLEKTTAPFVLFLDADDQLLPGSLDTIVNTLDSGISKIQFQLVRINETGAVIAPAFPVFPAGRERDKFQAHVNKSGTYVSPPTSGNVFRRDVCTLLRHASYDTAVDGVILTAAPFFGDIVSLNRPLGCYRIHGKNKSGVQNGLSLALLEKHKRRFSDRVTHLKSVLRQNNLDDRVEEPQSMYFYNINQINQDIILGKRVPFRTAVDAIRQLPSWYSPLRRTATAVAILIAPALPNAINVRFINSWRFVIARLISSFASVQALTVGQRSPPRSPVHGSPR
ncbi:glycosyltransferase family A protein [Methylobacterium mesophilicum]|uniref:glycosyltransferase family 2 protein n=1 Tax=Methylobacterium mesophilicum TaxID=39956 RepID=UPI002F3341E3